MSDEDPNFDVLKKLDVEMDRIIKIRSAVSEALEVAYVTARALEASKKSHIPAGAVVDRAIENATRRIMKLFHDGDEE